MVGVIPTGAPAWMRSNGFDSYGGNLQKKNFASRGAINPKTDVSAEAFSRITADLAALARTAPFAVMTLLCNDASPADPTVEFASLMTGVRSVGYSGASPPDGFPAATRNGNGDFTVTFDSSYTDEYGIAGSLVLASPYAQLVGSTAGVTTAELVGTSQVRVRVFDLRGAPLSGQRISISLGSTS